MALGVAVAATVLIWLLLFRGGESTDTAGGRGGAADARPQVARVESRLSVPEMVDQVMLIGFHGTSASGDIEKELRGHQDGAVLVGAGNWPGKKPGAQLVANLRASGLAGGRVAPLVVAQQEGGDFRTLRDLPPTTNEFHIGASGKPAAVESWARTGAGALRAEGFDLDLFPVADITGTASPVAERGFSSDPRAVAAFTAAAVKGCIEARMACAPSHFPGLGSASQDTDQGPATVQSDERTLASQDIPPFKAAFKANAPAVVLSLAYYAAYDPVTPGALTEAIDTGLLRDQLGFKGAAITDDLEAGAVRANIGIAEAAVEAIVAGADMVQVSDPADVPRVRAALLDAAESGRISSGRLADAAARVLELKRQVGLLRGR